MTGQASPESPSPDLAASAAPPTPDSSPPTAANAATATPPQDSQDQPDVKKQPRIWFSVGTKLIGLIAMLLMVSVASLVWLSTRMFIEDNTALIQQMNADTAASLATQMRELFENTTEKMRVLGTILLEEQAQKDKQNSGSQVTREFFTKDKDFLAVYMHKKDVGMQEPILYASAVSPEMKAIDDAAGDKAISALMSEKGFSLNPVMQGEVQIFTTKLNDGSTAVAVAIPFIQLGDRFSHTLIALIRQTRFVKTFSESDIVTSFMVDRQGVLLAHPDSARVNARENVTYLEIVKQLLEGKFNNGQTRYVDPQSKEAKLGAFRTVGFGGMGVIAEVAEAKAFEAAKRVEYRSMLVAFIILCVSFLAGYLYSGTITWPIKQLVDAAHRISAGDFKISLKPKSKDEIAHLSTAFNEMAKGLEERDKVKETFNKFHNKEIAEKLLSGEVKLGGERKTATIFFSDVRGFTAMSETMEPEQVVEMLNEYMTRMVAIIRNHHGIVDKYVGDAIMALWGVPIGGPDDAYNALRACLAMREDLAKLNELRMARGQNALKIGMGLNTGPVIAGNIGSNEKMEYTVIGDSVNLASRMESMTKEYGTDLLIPKAIAEQLKGRFIFEQCKSAKVKGKSTAIEIFKVKGYIDETGKEMLIETPYSSYEAEKSDKVVHDDKPEDRHGEAEVAEGSASAAPTAKVEAPAKKSAPQRFDDKHGDPPPDFAQMARQVTSTAPAAPQPSVTEPAPVAAPVAVVPQPSVPAPAPAPAAAPEPRTAPIQISGPVAPSDDLLEGTQTMILAIQPLELTNDAQKDPDTLYVKFNAMVLGPFTSDEIHNGISRNEFPAESQIGAGENGPWQSLSDWTASKNAA